jgi:hypothetical protein
LLLSPSQQDQLIDTMSKDVKNFFGKIRTNFDMSTKLTASHQAGSRIVPSRTAKNDADYQLRIDAGESVGSGRNVVLQINSQARSSALKEWVQKNGSHAKLAQATFDTTASDLAQETERVLAELEKQGKECI